MSAVRRMLVLCPFPEGVAAGQRLKYEQYFDDWRAQGWEITVSPFMDQAMWDVVYAPGRTFRKMAGVLRGELRRLRDYGRIARFDLVYVFMNVTPLGTSLSERLVRRLAKRVVYDLEDNVMNGPAGAGMNPLVALLKGTGKITYLIRAADHVIASSPFLAQTCAELNHRGAATYISSSVDTDRFVPAAARVPGHPVTVGWTGTFSSRPYLDLLAPVFRRLAERVPFTLRVIGNFDYALPGVPLEVITWTKAREVEDLQAIDIGVYPLPVDDWVTGKSGLKAIQYMAFGIPPVATEVGTTPLLIRNDENGLLVRSEDEWVDALERLIRDPALRARLGAAARRDAVAKYSVAAVAADYRRVLVDAVDGARSAA
jgi:glycosyltransferase involved in cell wall biosynthesis